MVCKRLLKSNKGQRTGPECPDRTESMWSSESMFVVGRQSVSQFGTRRAVATNRPRPFYVQPLRILSLYPTIAPLTMSSPYDLTSITNVAPEDDGRQQKRDCDGLNASSVAVDGWISASPPLRPAGSSSDIDAAVSHNANARTQCLVASPNNSGPHAGHGQRDVLLITYPTRPTSSFRIPSPQRSHLRSCDRHDQLSGPSVAGIFCDTSSRI